MQRMLLSIADADVDIVVSPAFIKSSLIRGGAGGGSGTLSSMLSVMGSMDFESDFVDEHDGAMTANDVAMRQTHDLAKLSPR